MVMDDIRTLDPQEHRKYVFVAAQYFHTDSAVVLAPTWEICLS